MKKLLLVNLGILTSTALLVLAGCHDRLGEAERKAFTDATIVAHFFPVSPDGSLRFQAGSYQGGTAVVGPGQMAFWVRDGQAYTVNQAAREAASELPQAPDSVKYDVAFLEAAYHEQGE